MAAPYDARSIANLILDLGEQRAVAITQIVLLKIVYFSHGWYLAKENRSLVLQEFEAWKYGPVIKVVRDSFKDFGDKPIVGRARRFNIFEDRYEVLSETIEEEDRKHVEIIFRTYSIHNAWTLSEMTHEGGSPWDQVWNAAEPIGRLGMRIRNEDIRQHFIERLGGKAVS